MIRLIQYNEAQVLEKELQAGEAVPAPPSSDMVSWLIADLHQPGEVEHIAAQFQVGELVLEDIQNREHLPKFELLENGCLLILKRLRNETEDLFDHEHICLILTENSLITFCPHPDNMVIESILNRIRRSLGKIRKGKADYLFYRFIDLVVDEYLVWTEQIREQIENLDESADGVPEEEMIREIRNLKKTLGDTRKYLYPLRDQVSRIRTEASNLIRKSTLVYLQDVTDHLGHVNASFEQFREMLKDVTDLYLSLLSQSSNEVMKTLTIVATIFIPLTFVVGWYGMNFKNMPEIGWKWSYPGIILLMIILTVVMVIYMKRKKWF